MKRRALLSGVIALTLVGGTAACSNNGDGDGGTAGPPAKAGVNDISTTPRDNVKKGGQLVWPVSDIPATFNYLHLDGTLADNADIMYRVDAMVYLTDAAATRSEQGLLAEEPRRDQPDARSPTSSATRRNERRVTTVGRLRVAVKANTARTRRSHASSNGTTRSRASPAAPVQRGRSYLRAALRDGSIFTPLYKLPRSARVQHRWAEKMPGRHRPVQSASWTRRQDRHQRA